MLSALSIRNIVLIEKLDISLSSGLTVLTGETGAGKSILLDALGLALGARGTASLVRTSADRGVVTAAFDLPPSHSVFELLRDHGVSTDDGLVVRRIQSAGGQSKAFVNDQPVSVGLLRQIGARLVEIHGQHDDRAMIDPGEHRRLLDAFGGLHPAVEEVTGAYQAMRAAEERLEAHRRLEFRNDTDDFLG